MKDIIDIIVLILFVLFMVALLKGFNQTMMNKYKEKEKRRRKVK